MDNKGVNITPIVIFPAFSENKIIDSLNKSGLQGNLLVGNESGAHGVIRLKYKNGSAMVAMLNSPHLAHNRNTLLRLTDSYIVTFVENPVTFKKKYEKMVEQAFKRHPNDDAIRFHFISTTSEWSLADDKTKEGRLTYQKLKHVPLEGIFFKTSFFQEKGLKFDHLLGPGAEVNHGDLLVFFHSFFSLGGKMYQEKQIIMGVNQRNTPVAPFHPKNYMYSEGYLAYKLHEKDAQKRFKVHFKKYKRMCPNLSDEDLRVYFQQGLYDAKYRN